MSNITGNEPNTMQVLTKPEYKHISMPIFANLYQGKRYNGALTASSLINIGIKNHSQYDIRDIKSFHVKMVPKSKWSTIGDAGFTG